MSDSTRRPEIGEDTLLIDTWFDTSGGQDSYENPTYLQPNQAAGFDNVNLDKIGIRRLRSGVTCMGGPRTAEGYPRGFGVLMYDRRYSKLLGIWGTHLWESNGDGSWVEFSTAVSVSEYNQYAFVQGQSYVSDECTGLFNPCYWIYAYAPYGIEGAPAPDFTPLWQIYSSGEYTVNVSLCPRAVCWWQNRLWCANILHSTELDEHTLLWSNIFDGGAIDYTNYVQVNSADGDEICALLPARAPTNRLYVFKHHSIWALDVVWGSGVQIPSTENTLDTTNSTLFLVSERIGCVAPRSIAYTGYGRSADIFFLARDGVRSLRRVEEDIAGGAGEPISRPIQDIIDQVDPQYIYTAAAAVWDNKYFLSLPEINKVVVYDLIYKRWLGSYNWAVIDWGLRGNYGEYPPNLDLRLYFQMNGGSYDLWGANTTVTAGYHVFQVGATTYKDPGTTAITYSETSRAFTFNQYHLAKQWNWAEYWFDVPASSITFSVYARVDESDWGLIYTGEVISTTTYPVIPPAAPWTAASTRLQKVKFNLTNCPIGHALQLKLSAYTGTRLSIRGLRVAAWPYQDIWTE